MAAAVVVFILLALGASRGTPAQGVGGAWTPVDATAGDAVHSLAVSGTAVLGGTYYNGLFRISGGITTQPLAAPLAAIARHPTQPSSVVAGAWFEGSFTSTDGGQSWTADAGGLAAIDVYSLAFVGTDRFAGTSAGVFYRGPGGWEPRSTGLSARNVFALLAVAPTPLEVNWALYAGTDHGVYVSEDRGLGWQPASAGLGDVQVHSLVYTGETVAGSRLVAGSERGIYHSEDGGLNWALAAPGLGAVPVRTLATMVAQPRVVFAGTGAGPFVSEDGGMSWQAFGTDLTGDAGKILSLAVAGTCPETVYAGTGAGVWQNSFDPTAGDPDGDCDGVTDLADNCPTVSNPDQPNYDADPNGDACDVDDDGDGFRDTKETYYGSNPLDPQCANANNDDASDDSKVNDGCAKKAGPAENPQCANTTNDDSSDDSVVNDGCPASAAAESGTQCTNSADDDRDGFPNDGCPQVGAVSENQGQCDGSSDNDGDGWVNDGCPLVGTRGEGSLIEVCDGLDNDADTQVDEGYPDSNPGGPKDCMDSLVDTDGDTVMNTSDTDDDTDGDPDAGFNDGFPDTVEAWTGTDSLDACPDDTNDDAWPADFNGNRTVNILDVLLFPPVLGSTYGGTRPVDPNYNRRFDLNANQLINILDVLFMPPHMGPEKTCTN